MARLVDPHTHGAATLPLGQLPFGDRMPSNNEPFLQGFLSLDQRYGKDIVYLVIQTSLQGRLYTCQKHPLPGAPSDPRSMPSQLSDAQGLTKGGPEAQAFRQLSAAERARCEHAGGVSTSFSYVYDLARKFRKALTARHWCAPSTQPFGELQIFPH